MELNKERLKGLRKFNLDSGKHSSVEEGACVMEMVSYVAGEKWTDRPECACPILTRMAISLNDRADDKTRQKLKPLVIKLAGSRSTKAVEKERGEFLALQAITVFLPLLTDALKLKDVSKRLRSFKRDEWADARQYILDNKQRIRDAAAYAAAAAADAAAYAAYAAYAYAYAYAAAADAAAYAAYAYAYAAAAAYAAAEPAKARKWRKVRTQIWDAAFKALSKACAIKE